MTIDIIRAMEKTDFEINIETARELLKEVSDD